VTIDNMCGLLRDRSYAKHARRLGALIQAKPITSLEMAMSWVELLAEFQDLSMLQPQSKNLNFIAFKQVAEKSCGENSAD